MHMWEPKTIRPREGLHWTLGPLDIWARHEEGEWQAAAVRGEENRPAACETVTEYPAELAWRRWTGQKEGASLRAAPLPADRPVVVRPAAPLSILPGEEVRFFVGMTLWVRLTLLEEGGREIVLLDEHTKRLSNTWFGLPTNGEFCYALPTRARLRLEDVEVAAHRAICPLRIRNEALEPLEIQRLCLRTAHLSLYQGQTHIWTGGCEAVNREKKEQNILTYPDGPPPFDGAEALICAPREPVRHGLGHKFFGGLRAFTQG